MAITWECSPEAEVNPYWIYIRRHVFAYCLTRKDRFDENARLLASQLATYVERVQADRMAFLLALQEGGHLELGESTVFWKGMCTPFGVEVRLRGDGKKMASCGAKKACPWCWGRDISAKVWSRFRVGVGPSGLGLPTDGSPIAEDPDVPWQIYVLTRTFKGFSDDVPGFVWGVSNAERAAERALHDLCRAGWIRVTALWPGAKPGGIFGRISIVGVVPRDDRVSVPVIRDRFLFALPGCQGRLVNNLDDTSVGLLLDRPFRFPGLMLTAAQEPRRLAAAAALLRYSHGHHSLRSEGVFARTPTRVRPDPQACNIVCAPEGNPLVDVAKQTRPVS